MTNKDSLHVPYDIVREDGRLEKMCPHGIGHTVGHLDKSKLVDRYTWAHGCDGCCNKFETECPDSFEE